MMCSKMTVGSAIPTYNKEQNTWKDEVITSIEVSVTSERHVNLTFLTGGSQTRGRHAPFHHFRERMEFF